MAFNQLTALDFNDIKASIKDYLKSSDVFTDYNFEGSALSNLIDVLAYNTYYTAFNTNFVINESFLDSATVRDNVVRLAKILNYTPHSAQSSVAKVNMVINVSGIYNNNYPDTITLKAGICFNSTNDNGNYIFSIPNDIVAVVDKNTGIVNFENFEIYEGTYLNYSYTVDTSTIQKFIIPNKNVDLNNLTVKVVEDRDSVQVYKKLDNIIKTDSNSRIYFIQETYDEKFEIIFGDGIFGKKLNDENIINISYIVTNGNLGNNCKTFNFIGNLIDSRNNTVNKNVNITTLQTSIGGSNIESISSIKYNAPRFYQTQGRAVTAKDYESLLPTIYSNIDSVTVYGGEDDLPPQYGVVNLVIKPKIGLKLSDAEKLNLKKQLANYSVGSIVPQIKDPSIIYIVLKSTVYYNSLLTTRTSDQIKLAVINSIVNLNQSRDFNKFGGKFKYSKLLNLIDNTDTAITSDITKLKLKKYLSVTPNVSTSYRTCFSNIIANFSGAPTVTSSGFKIFGQDQNRVFYFEDDTLGNIKVFSIDERNVKNYLPNNTIKSNFGSVNYQTGEVIINPINVTSTINTDSTISLYVIPNSNDIISLRDTYLTIDTTELNVTVVNDYISEGRTNSAINITPVSSY